MAKSKLDLESYGDELNEKYFVNPEQEEETTQSKSGGNMSKADVITHTPEDYKSIFDNSLDNFKSQRVTVALYKANYDRVSTLSTILGDKNKLEIINYIVHAFFKNNKEQILEDHKRYVKELKTDNFNL